MICKCKNVYIINNIYCDTYIYMYIYRYKNEVSYTGILKLLHTFVQFIPPFIISNILSCVGKQHYDYQYRTKAVVMGLMLFFIMTCKSILENQYMFNMSLFGSKLRSILLHAIYKRLLKLRVHNTISVLFSCYVIKIFEITMISLKLTAQ